MPQNPLKKRGSIILVLFVIVSGLRLVLSFHSKPQVVLPPPLALSSYPEPSLPPLAPAVTPEQLKEMEQQMQETERKLAELSKPPEARTPPPETPPAPPPPPAFRASKPGADQFQPLPFPAGVTEPYTPEGFKKNLERALKECPMGAMELVSMDCAEFPCMAVTELKDETARQANLNECMPWIDIYKGGTQYVSGTQKRNGQELHYMSWVPLPPHSADAKLVMLRSTRRAKALVKKLAAP